MNCSNCGVCCTETEMLLSKNDIKRIENQGYSQKYFVLYNKQGYAELKNREGYCVFYDPKKRRCNVYIYRPYGCRVYPVIFDEENGIILDTICEARNTISNHEKKLKGKRVINLLRVIDTEANERCKH